MIPLCILAIESESDREFMTALYLNYNQLMQRQILKIVRDEIAVEDLFQDVLEKLVDRVSDLRNLPVTHLIKYVTVACKNHSYNYLRRKRALSWIPLENLAEVADPNQDRAQMELSVITSDSLSKLSKIWPKLDERSQYLLESYYFAEMTPQEIGKTLGIKPESVRMALTRARKTAYRLIEEET